MAQAKKTKTKPNTNTTGSKQTAGESVSLKYVESWLIHALRRNKENRLEIDDAGYQLVKDNAGKGSVGARNALTLIGRMRDNGEIVLPDGVEL